MNFAISTISTQALKWGLLGAISDIIQSKMSGNLKVRNTIINLVAGAAIGVISVQFGAFAAASAGLSYAFCQFGIALCFKEDDLETLAYTIPLRAAAIAAGTLGVLT